MAMKAMAWRRGCLWLYVQYKLVKSADIMAIMASSKRLISQLLAVNKLKAVAWRNNTSGSNQCNVRKCVLSQ